MERVFDFVDYSRKLGYRRNQVVSAGISEGFESVVSGPIDADSPHTGVDSLMDVFSAAVDQHLTPGPTDS